MTTIATSVQTRDTALQNEVVRLYAKFLNNGEMSNPQGQPLVEIIAGDGTTILDSLQAQQEHTGIFYVDWFVPKDLPVGTYYDRWTFQWDATSSVKEMTMPIQVRTFDSYINFISRGVSHDVSSRVLQLKTDLENFFIYEATHIPIYWEQAMRIQQEDIRKQQINYYYLELNSGSLSFNEGDVYFHNGQKYTVLTYSDGAMSTSSSSSMDDNEISSSSSSEGLYESESTSTSSSIDSSSTSSYTDDLDAEYSPKSILTVTGYKDPQSSGTMTKVTGSGTQQFAFSGFSSKRSRFSTIYSLAYRNWVRDWKPIVRLNNRIIDDGWYTDYDGKIYFDRVMSASDTVHVSYKFSCFSDEQMLGFLRFGLKMMNTVPPSSTAYRNLDVMPGEWDAPVLLYAAVQAMRRAVFSINFQEKRAIYGGAGNDEWAQQALSSFQSLYQDYNSQWEEVKKDVKSKRLPGIAMYVTPEYTLPGGRSRWFRYLYKGGN
jgi:hypothetical protein